MHLVNQFIMQLPINYKSRHTHIILMVSQLTYLTFLRKMVRKYLLTLYAHLNPPTLLNPAIIEYNTLLRIVLEDLYEKDARLT
jgi:hypothetical protein